MKPSTPASCSAATCSSLPGTTPPQNPTSTNACRPAASRFTSSAATVVVGGSEFSGMSTIVVTPPAAAARVAVSNPSQCVRPGSLTCTWLSTSPGSRARSPRSTTARAPAGTSSATSTIRPPLTTTAPARSPSGVTTRRPTSTRSAAAAIRPIIAPGGTPSASHRVGPRPAGADPAVTAEVGSHQYPPGRLLRRTSGVRREVARTSTPQQDCCDAPRSRPAQARGALAAQGRGAVAAQGRGALAAQGRGALAVQGPAVALAAPGDGGDLRAARGAGRMQPQTRRPAGRGAAETG